MSGEVVITTKEIYDAVQELSQKMTPVPAVVADHEGRIRYLEKAVWIYTGIAAAGGAGATQLLQALFGG